MNQIAISPTEARISPKEAPQIHSFIVLPPNTLEDGTVVPGKTLRVSIIQKSGPEKKRTYLAYDQNLWDMLTPSISTLYTEAVATSNNQHFIPFSINLSEGSITTKGTEGNITKTKKDFTLQAKAAFKTFSDIITKNQPLAKYEISTKPKSPSATKPDQVVNNLKNSNKTRGKENKQLWLEDKTIITYFEYLQANEAEKNNYFYYQMLMKHEIDVANIQVTHQSIGGNCPKTGLFFLPIHHENHYVMLTIDFDRKTIFFYDPKSHGLNHYKSLKTLQEDLNKKYFNGSAISLDNVGQANHQNDSFNCGRYVLDAAEKMVAGSDDSLAAFQAYCNAKIDAVEIAKRSEQKATAIEEYYSNETSLDLIEDI